MTKKPCAKKQQTITGADLPLCCPTPGERLWDGHPRVYLDIEKTGEVTCPYCETNYILGPVDISLFTLQSEQIGSND